jgi:sugar lactone lactonase YvrE
LQRDGKLVDVIPAREGFLNDFSFTHDRAGNQYWNEYGSNTVIKKRTPGGKISNYLTHPFRAIGSLTALPDGTLLLLEEGKLRRISTTGEVTTIAERVTSQRASADKTRDPHYYFGMWTDGTGAVYVSVFAERMVVKVTPQGELQNIIASSEGWGPTGGLFDRNGELWLLETSGFNEVRVRHVSRNGKERIF